MYLWCTLRLEERYRILAPSPREVGLDLFLPGLRPRRVVLLRDANALMPEKHRDAIHGDARGKESARESVAESVSMSF